MILLVLFIMGVACGHIITDLIIVRPMRKAMDELLDFIKKWEIETWDPFKKK